MRNLWMMLLGLALTACSDPPTQVTRTELFEVMYLHDRDRTTYHQVDLKNVKTGEVSLAVGIRRHCEETQLARTKVGTRWELPVTTYTYESGKVERQIHAHSLCQTQPVDPVTSTTGYQSVP